jgi:hypothetical protein
MATLGSNVLTLADWAKRLDPDGKVPKIVELLSQTNEILDDMLWMEGNLPTGHRTTVRTGLPTVAWRLLNQGVQPSKSTTAQIDEACGMLEAWSEVDKRLADLNGNASAFRLSEAQAFIESMNQEMASTLFYGNSSTAPEEFTGLAARYSSLTAANGQNIVSGSGTDASNQSSIWLVCWGAQSVFGIFPKGSKAGLTHVDHGAQVVETTAGIAGSRMVAYRDQWQWDCGVALKDWRYVVRGANIDISNLVAKSSAADLIEMMIKMIHRVPNIKMGKPVFYMNRTVFQMLDIQRRDDAISGGGITLQNVDGQIQYSFRNIPVKICDALLETESQIS